MSLTLYQLQEMIMQQARDKGWGINPEEIQVGEKIALIHSEVSEAFQAYRHNNIQGKGGFHEELGDVVIRIVHLCGILGIDLEKEMVKKLQFNETRDWNWDLLSRKR